MATRILSNAALTKVAVLPLPVALPDGVSQRDTGTLTLALNCTTIKQNRVLRTLFQVIRHTLLYT
ncbi:MAG: hypothetical protein LBV72_12360 [Tannerella sp.]|nr:hypothetical protein [Tannerella sp.]